VPGILAVAGGAAPSAESPPSPLVTHPIDPSASIGAAAPAEYLDRYVANRSVVELGESIHITEEFPRVRLQLLQRLHEHDGFDVLAFEGTAIGSWLAQDQLYHLEEPLEARARGAQRLAWFGLWQTEPMLEVMRYVASSLGTPTPLYLSSFDIQPGSSRAFDGSGAEALDALFSAVTSYEPPTDPTDPTRWRDAIAPLLICSRSGQQTPAQRQVAEQAVSALETWLVRASSAVGRLRAEQHALALQQIPVSLRASIELCMRVQGASLRTFQETRDALNAERAIQLRDHVSRSHKIMLWAHHSHTNYNVTGSGPSSMGQHLRERLADGVYNIGLFAGGGEAVEIRETSFFLPVVPRQIRPARDFGVEGLLASLRTDSYFIDLASLRENPAAFAPWFEPRSARFEVSARTELVLARDFDAAVFVREVHAPRLLMLSAQYDRRLRFYGQLLDHWFATLAAATAAIAAAVVAVRRGSARLRRKKSSV
jgi:erythromycin esterase-like protein